MSSEVNSTERKKLLERIKALLALGNKDKNDCQHEVNTALAKAQELLKKYNLDISEVMFTDGKSVKFGVGDQLALGIEREKLHSWEQRLLAIVAEAFNVEAYACLTDKWEMRFIGEETDISVACELYKYIYTTLISNANKLYDLSKSTEIGRKFFFERDLDPKISKLSYLEGAIQQLRQRVRDEKLKAAMTKETPQYDLMVQSKTQAIKEYKEDLELEPPDQKPEVLEGDPHAFDKGTIDAKKLDLSSKKRLT